MARQRPGAGQSCVGYTRPHGHPAARPGQAPRAFRAKSSSLPALWPFPRAPAQARSDAHLLDLWLFGKSPHTRRAYQRVAGAFLATLGPAGLRTATLGDLQARACVLPGKASSRAVTLAAVKSLLTFGHRIGYLPLRAGSRDRAGRRREAPGAYTPW